MPKTDAVMELSTEVLAATLSVQSLGLNLLLAEMRALSEVLPGAIGLVPARPEHIGAAEESNFDNMPV